MADEGSFLGPLEPDRMTDAGMYWWAAIITVATLVVAYFVAVWWQKWKDSKKA